MPKMILHVEDDENDVILFQHALRKAGLDCPLQVVTDGQMAIDYLRGSGDFADRNKFPLPSVVLLDLKLPNVPGLEVLKLMRQELGPEIPVVVLSSSQQESDIVTAYKLGANAYLVKPADMGRLQEMVKLIAGFWLEFNTLPPRAKRT
jgi:CheY-like chemotaxis protein